MRGNIDSDTQIEPAPPPGCSFQGIDVSHFDNNHTEINWTKVIHDNNFPKYSRIFFKATEGLTLIDPTFAYNAQQLPKFLKSNFVGLGTYHYFLPKDNGTKQAIFYLNTLKKHKLYPALFPVTAVDVETIKDATKTDLVVNLREFISAFYNIGGSRIAFVYTSAGFWNYNFDPKSCDIVLNQYLWLSEYDTKVPRKVHCFEQKFGLWQYTKKGSVSGIKGDVDLDCFPVNITENEKMADLDTPISIIKSTDSDGKLFSIKKISPQTTHQNRLSSFIDVSFDPVILDALKQGAFHGIVAGISEQVHVKLRHLGYSKSSSRLSQRVFYYGILFAVQFYNNMSTDELNEFNFFFTVNHTIVKTLVDMSILVVINYNIHKMKPALTYLSKLSKEKWHNISNGLEIIAQVIDYIPFAFQFFSKGILPTTASIVSGAVTKKGLDTILGNLSSSLFAPKDKILHCKQKFMKNKIDEEVQSQNPALTHQSMHHNKSIS